MTTTASADTATRPRLSLAMSARDLITIGIFVALYIVLYFAITSLGFFNPVMMLGSLAISIVVGAIPFLLFLTRVKHAGMVVLFAIVLSALFLVAGYAPISIVWILVVSVIIEAILYATRYRSRWAGVISYTIWSSFYITPLLPLYYAREEYFASPGLARMGPDYVAGLDAFLTPGVLIGFDLATVVLGFVGGVLALGLLRKHFAKAGLA